MNNNNNDNTATTNQRPKPALKQRDFARLGVVFYRDLQNEKLKQAAHIFMEKITSNLQNVGVLLRWSEPFGISYLAKVMHKTGERHHDRSPYGDGWDYGYIANELPLHRALERDCSLKVIQCLVEAFPAACQIPTNDRQFPLHVACRCTDKIEVIEYLYKQYPEALTAGSKSHGWYPLYFAIRHAALAISPKHNKQHFAIIQYLVELNPKTAGPLRLLQPFASPVVRAYHIQSAYEMAEQYSHRLGTSRNRESYDRILEFLRLHDQQQSALYVSPEAKRRMILIRNMIGNKYRSPRITKLPTDLHRFVEVTLSFWKAEDYFDDDDFDCFYYHMRSNVDQLAILVREC